ncbi:putative quinol monooxygenase [Dyella koreensis]|uniref:Antibiotic biosynthesis monooxygenase n=1 Tax=Dyella koreensis TaxID=311235 RepID=A0ABW8K130_9GAMM
MIIVAGYLTVDPGQLKTFEKAIADVVDIVRKEDGCHHYSVLAEDRDRGLINITEVWRDQAAVDAHMAQPWIKSLFVRVMPLITSTDAPIYEVVGVRERHS